MKVILPEPISPEVLYEFNFRDQKFETSDLENLLNEIVGNLDLACERLRSREFVICSYEILFYQMTPPPGIYLGDFLSGGMNLEARDWNFSSLDNLIKRYKESLKKVMTQYIQNPFPLFSDISLIGFRDSISSEVEAVDPF